MKIKCDLDGNPYCISCNSIDVAINPDSGICFECECSHTLGDYGHPSWDEAEVE